MWYILAKKDKWYYVVYFFKHKIAYLLYSAGVRGLATRTFGTAWGYSWDKERIELAISCFKKWADKNNEGYDLNITW